MNGGPENVPSDGHHPEVELIAARAEGRLSTSEAARIDEHLAGCSTCYEVFAETAAFALAEGGEELPSPVEPAPSSVRRPVFQILAGLAAAAGLVLVLYPLWMTRSAHPTPSLVAELSQALGTTRFIEPRLTGGFQHGRLVVMRSGEASEGLDAHAPAVIAAVAHIRERTQGDTSPEALAALAATYLVSGDVAKAVKALESATAQDPKSAKLQSDLAAAYLVRASRLDEPADIPKALEAAEKAVEQKDAPLEAWWNRALALESLHLVDAARKAWDDYLQRDATSPWADEARKRRDDLPPAQKSTLEEDRSRARATLAEGHAAIDRLADEEPAVLRDYFDNVLLYAWADAYLAAKPEAAALRTQAELVGTALFRTTGDAMPRDAALALSAPPSGPSRDPPRLQAQGYRALDEAQRLSDAQQPACTPFREAQKLLHSGGSPYAAWVGERIVVACYYYQGNAQAGDPELARLDAEAERERYLFLLGRARWMRALFCGHRGEWTAAIDHLRRARDAFRVLRDTDSEAKVLSLLAQSLSLLGESRDGWKDRVRALGLLGSVRSVSRRQEVLAEASHACQYEELVRAALNTATANVEVARRGGSPARIANALIPRAVLLGAVGTREGATADLAEVRQLIQRVEESAMAKQLSAFADEAEGQILATAEPEHAARSLERAIAFFESKSPQAVPRLRLALARSQIALGRDEAAEAELETGIREMEAMRASQAGGASQTSFFERGASLFDDMVSLQLERRQDPQRALEFVERGRARQLADALRPPVSQKASSDGSQTVSALQLDEVQRQLPDGLALVYYVSLPGRVVSWVVGRESSEFFALPIHPDELGRAAAAHQAALEARAPIQVVREQAAGLFDALLRPLSPALLAHEALVLVPNGVLQAIPFASLWDRQTGRYLIEDHLVGEAPSGTVFVRARSASRGGEDRATRLLAVGNPRLGREQSRGLLSLRGAEAEAEEIAALYATPEVLTGPAATKSAFLAGLRSAQVVHFAGHATTGGARGTARLLLAPDPETRASGALYAFEIERQTLPRARLVVLAACGTAVGEAPHLEGTMSVARPFLAAGVPAVVASLWDADDSTSRHFFVAFHRNLLAVGDAATALRLTQLAFLRESDPVLGHPSSWAGFVSLGALSTKAPTLF